MNSWQISCGFRRHLSGFLQFRDKKKHPKKFRINSIALNNNNNNNNKIQLNNNKKRNCQLPTTNGILFGNSFFFPRFSWKSFHFFASTIIVIIIVIIIVMTIIIVAAIVTLFEIDREFFHWKFPHASQRLSIKRLKSHWPSIGKLVHYSTSIAKSTNPTTKSQHYVLQSKIILI